MKIAVVLLNLGGPSEKKDIRPFLYNFFMDHRVIQLPLPLRWLLAQLISRKRGEAYAPLGYKSPLLENTQAQARALEAILPGSRVFVCMRHWHPMAGEVAKEVAAFNPDKVILIPLYPQYSTTTTLSALEEWKKHSSLPAVDVCCYPTHEGFIDASCDLVRPHKEKRILFSAHGLPERIIGQGDPYQHQCELAAKAIAENLQLKDWRLCYQSRVGRLKWIGPSLDEEIEAAARDGVGVAVYPIAFVSEHVETLVELDMELREKAKELGVPSYARIPTVSTHKAFIGGLKDLVLEAARGIECEKICPGRFANCRKNHG